MMLMRQLWLKQDMVANWIWIVCCLGFRYRCWLRHCLTGGLVNSSVGDPIFAFSKSPKQESNGSLSQWTLFKQALISFVDNKGSAVGFVHEASQILGLEQDDSLVVSRL